MSARNRLVAVIEDEPNAADALALLLRDWGAEVAVGASTRSIASQLGARLSQVRWVITDFHLGSDADGVSLANDIAASAPGARVLVLSSALSARATAAAAEAGFEIMDKPARPDKIVAWLERA
jgi:DNA-binding NtrC family response regulator